MKNKYWTIQFVTNEGNGKYVKVISTSITKAVAWVCEHEKISAEQIVYASGEETEMV